jgi:dolichol-phosphate mannosyltransferase
VRISIVIPVLNEAGTIGRLIEEVFAVVPPAMLAEVIVVDDASVDATPDAIRALITTGALRDLRYLRHEARCGQGTAIRSGVLAARSACIATLDGDGQNDPADIARLADRLAAPGAPGPALVCGVRTRRKVSRSRLFVSSVAVRIRRAALRDTSPDPGCGIKVFWREAFLLLPFFASSHLYLPVLFESHGHAVAHVPVNDRLRTAGLSKFRAIGLTLAGIRDLAGVAWLRRRTKRPVIVEQWPDGGLEPVRPPVPDTRVAAGQTRSRDRA